MRHTDLVNAIEALVDATCADSVKDALAAVCAAKGVRLCEQGDETYPLWKVLARDLNAIPNLGV